MSEGTVVHSQISLASILVLVAALCGGFALISAGRLEWALGVAFPFAVGLIVGQFAARTWILLAPLAAALVVPIAWGAIGGYFDPPPNESTMIWNALAGLMLAPFVLLWGTIPAVSGSMVSRWLVMRRFSKSSD